MFDCRLSHNFEHFHNFLIGRRTPSGHKPVDFKGGPFRFFVLRAVCESSAEKCFRYDKYSAHSYESLAGNVL